MRALLLTSVLSMSLLAAPAVMAAPTCQNQYGDTARCGTAGAMPVGWSLSPDQRRPDTPVPLGEILGLISVLGGLTALILLMPKFDGRRDADWDRQADDD